MSYAVSLNGTVIYTPQAAAIDPRFSLLSGVLTEEENKIPKAELLLPPDNIAYLSAGAGAGTVEITDGAELLFTGRIRQHKDNFWNERSVTCEGALGYLADLPDVTTVASEESPVNVQAAFAALLADYAAKADAGRKIYAGTCDVVGSIKKNATGQAWDSVNGWVSEFGGFLTLRRTDGALYLDYKKDRPGLDSSQVIRFGVNLEETLDRLTDAAKIETGVLAIGGTPEDAGAPVTLSGYPGTENGVLFAATRAVYGTIYKRVEFKDALTQAALYAAAQAYLDGVAAAAVSLKLSAVENKLLGLAPHHMRISASYQTISEPHGLNAAFPLKARALNILAPDSSATEYGAAETALTEKQATWNRKTGKIEQKAEEAYQKANTAKITAEAAKTTANTANSNASAALTKANAIVDYIQETGTSGIWTYEKRASGKAECWGVSKLSVSANGWNGSGSTYYINGSEAFPAGLFTDAPELWVHPGNDNLGGNLFIYAAKHEPVTAATAKYRLMRSSNFGQAVTIDVNLHAIGIWK